MNKKEKIKILTDAGLNLNESKVLCWLLENSAGVSRNIERAGNLRQPEVSIAMSKFEKKGWIDREDIIRGKRGRPQKNYSIKNKMSTIDDIVSDLESKQAELAVLIKKLRDEW